MPKVGKLPDETIDGRHLLGQFIGGAITGWLVLGSIFYLDLSDLRTLIGRSDMWFVATVMLGSAFGMTFGIAAMATGLCWRGTGLADDGDRKRARQLLRPVAEPAMALPGYRPARPPATSGLSENLDGSGSGRAHPSASLRDLGT